MDFAELKKARSEFPDLHTDLWFHDPEGKRTMEEACEMTKELLWEMTLAGLKPRFERSENSLQLEDFESGITIYVYCKNQNERGEDL